MITSIVKTTTRVSVDGARLLTMYSLRLTRTLVALALKSLQSELEPEMPTQRTARPKAESRPRQKAASKPGQKAASRAKPPRARPKPRPKAKPAPPRKPAPEMDAAAKERADRTRAAETTPPPAEPSQPGIPGRDAPPARPPEPHHALNNPADEPDPTEWPDPFDHRPDPRDPDLDDSVPIGTVPHTPTGATSTSAPHPAQDPEAEPWEGPKRDKLDD